MMQNRQKHIGKGLSARSPAVGIRRLTGSLLMAFLLVCVFLPLTAFYLDYRCQGADLYGELDELQGYAKEAGVEVSGVELVLVDEVAKGNGYAHYIFGSSVRFKDGTGKITLRKDLDSPVKTLAHEYAHQVMSVKGYTGKHHGTVEFAYWENCLYASAALDTNLCGV